MKWQSRITKKTKEKKTLICHKLASDRSALAMMCGRDEEPWPSASARWKIAMACACCKAINVVDSGRWVSRGLKKTTNDAW